jgi:hypothetical protein
MLERLHVFITWRASMLTTALLIAALVLFILAALGVPAGNFSLVAAGLACWVASLVIGKVWA